MTELSGYVFSALRGGEFTLYRGSGDGLDPILLVAPIGEYSARESLKRLEHEHDLKAELDADVGCPAGSLVPPRRPHGVGARGPRRRAARSTRSASRWT